MTTFRAVNVRDETDGPRGRRVLVDRLWPRGVSRERADLDDRRPDLAPSRQLRQWFGHDPQRFDEFRRRYRDELVRGGVARQFLAECADDDLVVLVHGAADRDHNNAVVLAELLTEWS